MSILDHQPKQIGFHASAADELHVCNNLRHLVFALADIVGRLATAKILYLEDDAPLSPSLKTRLLRAYPNVDIAFSYDSEQIMLFAGNPEAGVIGRNIQFDWALGFVRATHSALPILLGQRFETGYIYHSGFFTSKRAAFSCNHVVMRESGLNNYVSFPVALGKAILRTCSGLNPSRQIWGEEAWVDIIEVSRPEYLPENVKGKGRKLAFSDLLKKLNSAQAFELAHVFVPEPPLFAALGKPRCLVITQPLDLIGLCSTREKRGLYQRIINGLSAQGYDVHIKHHPRDEPYELDNCLTMSGAFPVELLAALQLPKFDLAVALCSASLMEGNALIAEKVVQFLKPEQFKDAGLAKWVATLPQCLSDL
ncbi:hypothetical protein LY10_03100 [Planktotalea frisia]|jgi:hypothetical protein|uniref:Uncharacterized protein n=1 Tax=Planktotalea frisia TaxID=696762 RepID=A0A1L9NT99_9RHOB|nr:polysialyltransferase family glycosyltransferase [Planktotalea frisia]OJI92451.1 hypothetical protein PFRI_33210 [Planktotalea frisia]PZX23553.1 hypothetical protein LY10_03100 [Planktotalea frisia]